MFKKFNAKTVASNMILSAICKPVSMLLSYIYVPVVLDYLGVEKYGVWSTILSILSWISYSDIGIGNGLRNKLTESLNKHDGKGQKLVSSAYAFIAVIMIVVTVVFSLVASFVNWNRVLGVDYENKELASLIVLSVFFVAINFILSICKNVLYALQKAANVSLMELGVQTLNLSGVLFAMKYTSSNLFVMAFIYGMSMLVVNCVTSLILYSRNAELKPRITQTDFAVGKSITNLGIQFFIIQICALVLFTTDSLIISYLYGASTVTPYNTVNKLFQVLIGVFTALLAPIWSAVSRAKVMRKYEEILKLINRLIQIMIPFVIVTFGLMAVFRPISRIWLGKELNYTSILIVFGGLYCLATIWCNTFASISNGLELMNQSIVIAVIQAIINIPISLLLAEGLHLQSGGVLAGTVISMLVSAVAHPIIVTKYIKRSIIEKGTI